MAKQQVYYAVHRPYPCILFDWAKCKELIDGVPKAAYKKFSDLTEAAKFAEHGFGKTEQTEKADAMQKKAVPSVNYDDVPIGPYAFVDGSYNIDTGEAGYGGFMFTGSEAILISGKIEAQETCGMRNVAGEIYGAMAAVKEAERIGLSHVTLVYDYAGIEQWAIGGWKANNESTKQYVSFMDPQYRSTEVAFRKVKGHSGNKFNDMADAMAKHACGVELTRSEQALYEEMMEGNLNGFPYAPEKMQIEFDTEEEKEV